MIAEESTFCAIVIDYKAYIGGINVILVYDTITNDLMNPIKMPEWVVKIVSLSKNHILCGLRGGSLIIVDIQKKLNIAEL